VPSPHPHGIHGVRGRCHVETQVASSSLVAHCAVHPGPLVTSGTVQLGHRLSLLHGHETVVVVMGWHCVVQVEDRSAVGKRPRRWTRRVAQLPHAVAAVRTGNAPRAEAGVPLFGLPVGVTAVATRRLVEVGASTRQVRGGSAHCQLVLAVPLLQRRTRTGYFEASIVPIEVGRARGELARRRVGW
jgi:hypothetical protein